MDNEDAVSKKVLSVFVILDEVQYLKLEGIALIVILNEVKDLPHEGFCPGSGDSSFRFATFRMTWRVMLRRFFITLW